MNFLHPGSCYTISASSLFSRVCCVVKAVSVAGVQSISGGPHLHPCLFSMQMAQRKIRDILAQVKQQHQKGQSNQAQARRK